MDSCIEAHVYTWRLALSQQTCTISPLTTDHVLISTVDGAIYPTNLASEMMIAAYKYHNMQELSTHIKVSITTTWMLTGQEASYWTTRSVWTIGVTL